MAFTERYVTALAAGGGDGSLANPWTIQEAASAAVAGDRVNVKAGTYKLASSFSPSNDGVRNNPIEWRGYTSSPGDAMAPVATLDANGNNIHVLECARAYHRFRFLTVTGNASVPGKYGITLSGTHIILERCRCTNTWNGVSIGSAGGMAIGCEVDAWVSGASIILSGTSSVAIGCYVHDGSGDGYLLATADSGGVFYCIAHSCAGAGFRSGLSGAGYVKRVSHCIAYGNTGNGVESVGITDANPFVVINSILFGNGGYGIAGSIGGKPHVTLAGVAFGSNTSGDVNAYTTLFEIQPRISLAADPFVDPTNGDFRLRPDAAALLGAAFPNVYLNGGQFSTWKSHPDIGATAQAVRPVINPLVCGAF